MPRKIIEPSELLDYLPSTVEKIEWTGKRWDVYRSQCVTGFIGMADDEGAYLTSRAPDPGEPTEYRRKRPWVPQVGDVVALYGNIGVVRQTHGDNTSFNWTGFFSNDYGWLHPSDDGVRFTGQRLTVVDGRVVVEEVEP